MRRRLKSTDQHLAFGLVMLAAMLSLVPDLRWPMNRLRWQHPQLGDGVAFARWKYAGHGRRSDAVVSARRSAAVGRGHRQGKGQARRSSEHRPGRRILARRQDPGHGQL